jgi:hypothetical protein
MRAKARREDALQRPPAPRGLSRRNYRANTRMKRSWDRSSVAPPTHWTSFGDVRRRRRNDTGCASVSFTRAFRPPCQRTGALVRDSQWPGRRNLPRRGTPRRAPVRVTALGETGDCAWQERRPAAIPHLLRVETQKIAALMPHGCQAKGATLTAQASTPVPMRADISSFQPRKDRVGP